MPNRLASQTSQVLRQRAHDLVDWRPFDADAVAEAARRDVPLLMSISHFADGQSERMARESFWDPATAELMNRHFVCVAVDREEQPEVAALYRAALLVQGEAPGWPVTAFCTPQGEPFYVGAYYPATDANGRPVFTAMLSGIAGAWQNERHLLLENAASLHEGLAHYEAHFAGRAGQVLPTETRGLVQAAVAHVKQRLHSSSVPPTTLALLLHGESADATDAYVAHMRALCKSAAYDHVGGGIAHDTDGTAAASTLEKRLVDQAALLVCLADAIVRGANELTEPAHQTIAFLARELATPSGGFGAAIDGTSAGEAGAFVTWRFDELVAALGAGDALVFAAAYGVPVSGSASRARHALVRVRPKGTPAEEAELAGMRDKLFAARAKREQPVVDRAVIAYANALTISGLLAVHRVTEHGPAFELAIAAARHLQTSHWHNETLYRQVPSAEAPAAARVHGQLEDYAATALAAFDVADATGDVRWWQWGNAVLASALQRFVDVAGPLVRCHMAEHNPALPSQPMAHEDGDTPSGATLLLWACIRAGLVDENPMLIDLGKRMLGERLERASPLAQPGLFIAADRLLHATVAVVTEGEGQALLQATLRWCADPRTVIAPSWSSIAMRPSQSNSGTSVFFGQRAGVWSSAITHPRDVRAWLRT